MHRGSFTSVKDLNAKIRVFIDGWNNRYHSFVWTNQQTRFSPKPSVNRL